MKSEINEITDEELVKIIYEIEDSLVLCMEKYQITPYSIMGIVLSRLVTMAQLLRSEDILISMMHEAEYAMVQGINSISKAEVPPPKNQMH